MGRAKVRVSFCNPLSNGYTTQDGKPSAIQPIHVAMLLQRKRRGRQVAGVIVIARPIARMHLACFLCVVHPSLQSEPKIPD